MSAFTFTAPTITLQDEMEEREALTEEERNIIHEDLHGSEQEATETDELLKNGMLLLHEALEAIPEEEKIAYLEALERAPQLVERESKGIIFLRFERYDAWAAACRLVAYWALRKKCFGPERAFLPMTQSAAMAEDTEVLRKGIATISPDDKHGRPVFHWDRIRATGPHRDSVRRCLFYVLQALMEQDNAQRRGCVYVINLKGFGLYPHFDRILMKNVTKLVSTVPLRAKASHLLTGSGNRVMEQLVLPIVKQVVGKEYRQRWVLHSGSDTQVLSRLEEYGLGEEHIQTYLGNSLQHLKTHLSWLDERRTCELERETNVEDE